MHAVQKTTLDTSGRITTGPLRPQMKQAFQRILQAGQGSKTTSTTMTTTTTPPPAAPPTSSSSHLSSSSSHQSRFNSILFHSQNFDNVHDQVEDDEQEAALRRFSAEFVIESMRFSIRDYLDCGADNVSQQQPLPESKLHSCLDLLSSNDLDQNRLGLQRLNLLTKGRALSSLHRSEELASMALVYGGAEPGSVEDRLRYVFATLICDAPHDDADMVNKGSFSDLLDDSDADSATSSLYYDEDEDTVIDNNENDMIDQLESLFNLSDLKSLDQQFVGKSESVFQQEEDEDFSTESEDEDDSEIHGKAWGALHNQALRVLANALAQISPSPYTKKLDTQHHQPIPLHDTIWRNIIRTLVRNIETAPNADITGYSLKILRMVHSLHPETVQPLLTQSLFPHLIHLSEYGEGHRFPMIHQEASALLKRAYKNITV